MKTYRKELWFNLPQRRGFVCITGEVAEAVRASGVKEGLVLVKTRSQLDTRYSAPSRSSLIRSSDTFSLSA